MTPSECASSSGCQLSTKVRLSSVTASSSYEQPLPVRTAWTCSDSVVVLLLGAVNFSHTLCYSVLSPFFTTVAVRKGASLVQVGAILGAFELAGVIASLILGKHLIRIGSRFMFISGGFALGVSSALFGLLIHANNGYTFVVLCVFVRVFQGVASAAISTASFAILAYKFSENISAFVGGLETCSGLGFIIGPPIGGILYSSGGFKLPFVLVGGIAVFTSVVSFFFVPSIKDKCECGPRSYLPLVKKCGLWIPVSATILAMASVSFMDLALAAYLEAFGLSPNLIGLVFLVNSAGYTLTAPLWGLLVDKTKCTTAVLMVGGLVCAGALALLGPLPVITGGSRNLAFVWTAMLVLGFGISAEIIPPFIDALRLATEAGYPNNLNTFGLVSGLTNTCCSLGSFLGPSLGGLAVANLGFLWSITVLAILHMGLGLIITVYLTVIALRGHRGKTFKNLVIST